MMGVTHPQFILERMTFDQLVRYSEPKRVVRALTVRGPPLKIDANEDSEYWAFNFKAFPSTTGLRHHGFIKFLKPRSPRPLERYDCVVDCDCQDYRYRWAWANKQRQASKVGPGSMNGALNRAPRSTNPTNRPGLCKHLIALKEFIYGNTSKMFGEGPDDGKMLSKMVNYANKKWLNMPQELERARERDRQAAAARAARNRGLPRPVIPAPEEGPEELEIPDDGAEQGNLPTIPGSPEAPETTEQPDPNRRSKRPEDPQEENMVIKIDMNASLNEAIKTLQEMEASYEAPDLGEVGDVGPEIDTAAQDEPSEALDLLRQMVELLRKLADDGAPEEDESILPDEAEEIDVEPDKGVDDPTAGDPEKETNPAGVKPVPKRKPMGGGSFRPTQF